MQYQSFFERPPETQWNVISLGGGVQSSAMALMAAAAIGWARADEETMRLYREAMR